ncbi:Protein unc-45 A [Hypsizygus marmoreus]|uniref:Protein unc-45 A n=1 Tax=Hypsizygus marmoreus TaxID=39966 RepID=A0A369K8J9_HYPMA|nr:Protein unc-45 A [Hypsizygus marmoreus]
MASRDEKKGNTHQWEKPIGTREGSILPDELSYLITAFLPSHTVDAHSKAYLTLSAFCQGVRSSQTVKGKDPDPGTEALVRAFGPSVVSRLADTDEKAVLESVSFLTALFQVDWESASSVFQQDGVLEAIMDSVDLAPSGELAQNVAQLLSQACGHKPCRAILTSQAIKWLDFASCKTSDQKLCAPATTALIKLSKGSAVDNSEITGVSQGGDIQGSTRKDEDLAAVMKDIVVSGIDAASTSDAVEGLAYLTVDPEIKESLSRDKRFLQRLFALVPHHKGAASVESDQPVTTLVFGILVIISNLCAYRPHLTEEQAQMQKLRQMANAANSTVKTPAFESVDNDDRHVRTRVRRLVDAGVLEVFPAAIRTDSPGIRVASGKALLSIIEDKENRGKVLQSGGAKILTLIINKAMSKPSSNSSSTAPPFDPAYLSAIQALAKLAITSSPVQVFGPNEGAMLDAIRPFAFMLEASSSTLLQRFEAMMALTNLSSQSAELASRIASAEGLLNKVELLLLEDHTLIRRAAMELICNLIAGSDEVFERYGGGDNMSRTKSKLQVVIALSDVEDLPTRLAASGAVATLSSAPSACQALVAIQSERHRVLPILSQLIDPSPARSDDSEEGVNSEVDPGLIHRAVICTRNIFLSISDKVLQKKLSEEAEEAGLTQALLKFVRSQSGQANEAVLRPALEVLKVLMNKS